MNPKPQPAGRALDPLEVVSRLVDAFNLPAGDQAPPVVHRAADRGGLHEHEAAANVLDAVVLQVALLPSVFGLCSIRVGLETGTRGCCWRCSRSGRASPGLCSSAASARARWRPSCAGAAATQQSGLRPAAGRRGPGFRATAPQRACGGAAAAAAARRVERQVALGLEDFLHLEH